MPIVYKSGLLPLDAPAGKPLVRALVASMLVFGALASGAAHAQNAAMIEAGNQELRDDVQWLVDRGIIGFVSTSTWPIPVSVLETALEARKKTGLTRADVHAILAVRRYLDDQKNARYGLIAQVNTDSIPQLGFASQSRAAATGGAYIQGGNDVVAGKLQVNGLLDPITSKQSKANLEGSYVSARFLGQALYVGQLAHYWGPGVDGSLNWGNAGTAIPGIGLQRAKQTQPESKWLSWVGPWGYEVFLGQLQHDTAVPSARVINMRVFARPLQGLELGASRFIEWGGRGRDNGWSSLWNALKGNSNNPGNDPSNELSGFDIRYTIGLAGNPLTLYGQLAGEDEAGGLPSHYLAQFGIQFKNTVGSTRLQWHAEAADTTAKRIFGLSDGLTGTAYNHGTYRNGLYHDGLPIGHPIGGSGRLLSAGIAVTPDDFRYFSRYSFRIMQAQVNGANQDINLAFPKQAKWYAAELAYSWRLRPATFRAGLALLRRTSGDMDNSFSIMLSMNVPLGGAR
ncbi:hypothetical protein CDO44_12935 [Pigmentiphaga sp. NML080357]|nr:hypothetical protein CDO44_12935 [Pigmentiphaga sp. NML080357]